MIAAIEKQTIAIDIGGTKIAMAIVKGQNVDAYRKFETPRTGRGDDLVGAIATQATKHFPQQLPIAVATTGIVTNGCLTALNPSTLPIEDNFPLNEKLYEALGRRPVVVNDAQAATWGEFLFGAGAGTQNFSFITVSTGVGAGLVVNGKLLIGSTGLAGHVGHTAVDSADNPCGCGRNGCLEAIASGTAIASKASAYWGRDVRAPDVFAMSDKGDSHAAAIVSASAKAVATSVANLVAAFDLDCVAIGGGVGLADGDRKSVV